MAVKLFAAIDVGSLELELGIYEISQKTGILKIDHLRHTLALGRDTYNDGKISYELMDEMCRVLEDFVRVIRSYKIEDYRAYATSAMREAKNSQIALDHIHVRTGLVVKVISNAELRFLLYKAVAARGVDFHKVVQKGTALIDVGFGSTQISLFDKGTLISTQNIFLGVLRIVEMLAHLQIDAKQAAGIIEELVDNEFHAYKKMYLKDREVKNLICAGESILVMAKRLAERQGTDRVTAAQFGEFHDRILKMSTDEIEEAYELSTEYAAMMIPGAIIYKRMIDLIGAETIWIPSVRLCDGIAAEYAQELKLAKFSHDFNNDILSTARNMAKRYKAHTVHIQTMEKLVLQIFDTMKKYHGLGPKERLLLQIAAILHTCGKYISILRSSENSYRIIMSTEIIGLSYLEREIVANVVRYNHKAFDYKNVELEADLAADRSANISKNEVTIVIAKLTAMLRLANSLDRTHLQKFADCRMAVKDGTLTVTCTYPGDITLERAAFNEKGDFFEEIFGLRPVIKQKRGI